MAEFNGRQGVWRTIGGRRVFIADGEDLATAMRNSGKFKNLKDSNSRTTKQVNKEYEELSKKMQADDYYYRPEDDRRLKELRAEYDTLVAQGQEDVNLTRYNADNDRNMENYNKNRNRFKELYDKDYKTARTVFLKELGYGDKPKLLNEEDFNKIDDKKNPVMQRSTSDEGYDSLINGEYRTSSIENSMYGTGIYFAYGEDDKNYYAGLANTTKVFEARVDKSAKMIDSRKLKEIETDIRNKISTNREKIDSIILADNGILAASLGYDGVYFENVKYGLVLNRGKLIIKK